MSELEGLAGFAVDVALGAGRIQLEGLEDRREVELKGWRELVTPVDRACEEYVVGRIERAHPGHAYFAEEGHAKEGAGWRWIVDPIDGTTNYVQGLPGFSVSLGLEREGELVVGVVHAPYLRETFWGWRGGGAWLRWGEGGKRRLRVSEVGEVGRAVLSTGFAYVQNETPNHNLDNWERLCRASRGLRRVGSAALDLAYVACGRYDGFWEMHLKPYDVAGGAVLIEEAGGEVTDMFGGGDWLEGQSIVATNGVLHEALRGELAPVREDGWVCVPGEGNQ